MGNNLYVLVLVIVNHLMVTNLVCSVGVHMIDPSKLSLKRKIHIKKSRKRKRKNKSREIREN